MEDRRNDRRERARLYSLLHTGVPGDVAFYRARCEGASSILELGCGSGRLLGELAAAGPSVLGLDNDPVMLEMAGRSLQAFPREVRRRVKRIEGDMRTFRFGRKFDRILIPFNGLYCLPDDHAVRGCFRSIRLHLAEGGRFLFDVYQVHPGDEPDGKEDSDGRFEPLTLLEDGAETIEVRERDRWDPARKTIEATYLFTRVRGGPPRQWRETIRHRYLGREALLGLLEECGLRPVGEYGGFRGEPAGPESDRMVLEAA